MKQIIAIIGTLVATANLTLADEAKISPAARDERSALVHDVTSPYQAGETKIRVLLPDASDRGKRYRVLYVLPVEAQDGSRFGNGLQEIKKHDLHNKHRLICVAPTFSHLPWYADHPTDAEIRQETYFLKVVVPFIDRTYPVEKTRQGRLLVGFSKSGWGAYSLLIRHREVFQAAAAWDAPLIMQQPNRFGMGPIFGSQQNFEDYRIDALFKQHQQALQGNPRFVLTGYGSFREHHQSAHKLLTDLNIRHVYRDGPQLKHDWHSGWLAEAVELLVSLQP